MSALEISLQQSVETGWEKRQARASLTSQSLGEMRVAELRTGRGKCLLETSES